MISAIFQSARNTPAVRAIACLYLLAAVVIVLILTHSRRSSYFWKALNNNIGLYSPDERSVPYYIDDDVVAMTQSLKELSSLIDAIEEPPNANGDTSGRNSDSLKSSEGSSVEILSKAVNNSVAGDTTRVGAGGSSRSVEERQKQLRPHLSTTTGNINSNSNSNSSYNSKRASSNAYNTSAHGSNKPGSVNKAEELTLFIAVTSAPFNARLRQSARDTWLQPCKSSQFCDYMFFVDKVLNPDAKASSSSSTSGAAGGGGHRAHAKIFNPLGFLSSQLKTGSISAEDLDIKLSSELLDEQEKHHDIVFRGDWCALMARHDERINYGNAVLSSSGEEKEASLPKYQLRVMYKIDWKVCFTKWCDQNNRMALYHAYVEDDSFVCTENLLYQMTILKDMARADPTAVRAFCTGTFMWDGFDDSSTLMSREVAMAFAEHYPDTSGFNCSKYAEHWDPNKSRWMSWGEYRLVICTHT
jgi:hypothetical protein